LPESQASLHGLQVGVAAYAVSAIQEKTHKQVRQCLLDSGFVDYMKHHPLSKQAFLTAVQKAPRMKENFYTLLSESDSMAALLDFVHRDALLNEMLAE
jgi:glycerol-1-phosphate dehydrogenase [NAD(P)+]